MATMNYEVTIKNADGSVAEHYPAPTKESASKRGGKIAKEIGGTCEVKKIPAVEYNPADWN